MKIGNKIKSFRIEKRLTPETMAERLGISVPTYRRYENDTSFPDIIMVDKIAKTLNKNFTDLLPAECLVQNNNDQKGGVVVNLGTINSLSEKLIEQYEERIKEKDAIINELKTKLMKWEK